MKGDGGRAKTQEVAKRQAPLPLLELRQVAAICMTNQFTSVLQSRSHIRLLLVQNYLELFADQEHGLNETIGSHCVDSLY